MRLRARVDGDAERSDAAAARLLNRAAGVFEAEAALVVVDVVRLAVGEDEKHAISRRRLFEFGRRRGGPPPRCGCTSPASARRAAGKPQATAPLRNPFTTSILTSLRPFEVKPNTACGSSAASSAWQKISADSRATSITRRAPTKASVESEASMSSATATSRRCSAHGEIDAVRIASARSEVGARADDRVEVEVVAVDLRARLLAVRTERLELAPHPANAAKRLWRGRPLRPSDAERRHEDAAGVLLVGAPAPVPFRIAQAFGRRALGGGRRRQLEFELQAGRGGLSMRRETISSEFSAACRAPSSSSSSTGRARFIDWASVSSFSKRLSAR